MSMEQKTSIYQINKEWVVRCCNKMYFFINNKPVNRKISYAPLNRAKAKKFVRQILNGNIDFNQCFLGQ